ncbi:MAG: 6-bladed beta-propeller [Gemmatimonadota bacterium]
MRADRALLLVALALPGCGGAGDEERDSAPVEPILALDTIRNIESERLWRVRTARPGPAGSTVVLNGGSFEVFVFDSAGRLAQAFGGEGQGPGEFGSPRDIHVRGDSIYVIDTSPFSRRLSLFVDGTLTRDWSLGHVPGIFARIAVRGDGTPILAGAGERNALPAGIPAAPVFYRDSIAMMALPEAAELAQWEEAVEAQAQRVQFPDRGRASAQVGIDRWGGSIPRPIFEDLISDDALTAVQRYEFGPTHPTDWLVLDAAGDSVGGWQLPAHIRLLSLEGDRVLALARDSLDVESIIVFGIVARARITRP